MKRRTSLILGAVLALLLGAAAGFIILALPISMLETLTTSIGLSSLMIQAEPPISPNDRTVLAVLAAILTAGIGWVLVDWLLFGRVGMTTLIKPREDEYEDDDDAFRPTDPLDLITPVDVLNAEWSAPSAFGDARRPLSARTDIGDPPAPMGMAAPVPGFPSSAIGQALPPINQILPGMSPAPMAAPFAPEPAPFPPIPDPLGVFGAPPMAAAPPSPFDSPLPPMTAPAPTPADPFAPPAAPRPAMSGMPSWLPSPGVKAEEIEEGVADQAGVDPVAEAPAVAESAPFPPLPPLHFAAPPIAPDLSVPPPPPFAPPFGQPPLGAIPVPQEPFVPENFFGVPAHMGAPMPPMSQPPAPPMVTPFAEPALPVAQAPTPAPEPIAPPPLPVVAPAPAPVAAPPAPIVQAQAPVAAPPPFSPPVPVAPVQPPVPTQPAAALLASSAPLDRVMIDDLLTRLERGMRNRRTNALAAPAGPQAPAPIAPPPAPMPAPAPTQAVPPPPAYVPQPPAAPVAPPVQMPPEAPSWPSMVEPIVKRPPPAGFAMNMAPNAPPPITQLQMPQAAPAPAPSTPGAPLAADGDRMIDQPLHATLEQLRGMVRR